MKTGGRPNKYFIFILCSSFVTNVIADETRVIHYKVKGTETLGGILYSLGFCPLWGSHGSVQRIFLKNQNILSKGQDLIYPGQELLIETAGVVAQCKKTISRETASIETAAMENAPAEEPQPVTQELSPPNPVSDYKFTPYSSISIQPMIFFSNFRSTDARTNDTANLYSKTSPGMVVDFSQHWDEKKITFFTGRYRYLRMEDPIHAKILDNKNISLYQFTFGGMKALNEDFFLGVQGDVRQEALPVASSFLSLSLSRSLFLGAGPILKYNLLKNSQMALNLLAGINGYFGLQTDRYDTLPSFSTSTKLQFLQILQDYELTTSVFFDTAHLYTTISSNGWYSIGFTFGIGRVFRKDR